MQKKLNKTIPVEIVFQGGIENTNYSIEPVIDIPTAYQHYSARIVFIDSVVDGKLVKLEGYLTDTPINESSRVVRWQDEGESAVNKFFTKK